VTVVDDLDEARALKAGAKSARDDRDWDSAIADLSDAIDLLQDRLEEPSSAAPGWLKAELADTFGMVGGIEKRWGLELEGEQRRRHLKASVDAYDMGFNYEQGLDPGDANTYNRINRLVGRVLLDKNVLRGGGGAVPEFAEGLREAEEIVTKEIETARQRDPWAYCDLGTVRLLRGKPDALSVFHALERLRPDSFVYESVLNTLQPLSDVASDLRPDLVIAVAQLRRSVG
jgi:hypothetical protein